MAARGWCQRDWIRTPVGRPCGLLVARSLAYPHDPRRRSPPPCRLDRRHVTAATTSQSTDHDSHAANPEFRPWKRVRSGRVGVGFVRGLFRSHSRCSRPWSRVDPRQEARRVHSPLQFTHIAIPIEGAPPKHRSMGSQRSMNERRCPRQGWPPNRSSHAAPPIRRVPKHCSGSRLIRPVTPSRS